VHTICIRTLVVGIPPPQSEWQRSGGGFWCNIPRVALKDWERPRSTSVKTARSPSQKFGPGSSEDQCVEVLPADRQTDRQTDLMSVTVSLQTFALVLMLAVLAGLSHRATAATESPWCAAVCVNPTCHVTSPGFCRTHPGSVYEPEGGFCGCCPGCVTYVGKVLTQTWSPVGTKVQSVCNWGDKITCWNREGSISL
jgi:hypothetical protein